MRYTLRNKKRTDTCWMSGRDKNTLFSDWVKLLTWLPTCSSYSCLCDLTFPDTNSSTGNVLLPLCLQIHILNYASASRLSYHLLSKTVTTNLLQSLFSKMWLLPILHTFQDQFTQFFWLSSVKSLPNLDYICVRDLLLDCTLWGWAPLIYLGSLWAPFSGTSHFCYFT